MYLIKVMIKCNTLHSINNEFQYLIGDLKNENSQTSIKLPP